MAHYRSKINFTWESLRGAQAGLENLYANIAALRASMGTTPQGAPADDAREAFAAALRDDLNTPEALAVLHGAVRDKNLMPRQKLDLLASFDRVFGLGLDKIPHTEIPPEIKALFEEYEACRANKQFVQSDGLREKLNELGYTVHDTPDGPSIIRKTRI